MVEEKTAIILILAIVVVAAVPVLVMNMTTNRTGNFVYAGHTVQFDNPQEACERQRSCPIGPVRATGEVKTDLWPYGTRRPMVVCYCPDAPGYMLPDAPMTATLPLERY